MSLFLPQTLHQLVAHSLERQLALYVGLALLAFTVLAGSLTYRYIFNYQLEMSRAYHKQLALTVQQQVEVAVFASNQDIANDILKGLLLSPTLLAADIRSSDSQFHHHIHRSLGDQHIDLRAFQPGEAAMSLLQFALYSPIDRNEMIGLLILLENEQQLEQEARLHALPQVALLFFQLVVASLLLLWLVRRLVSQPVVELAERVAKMTPGCGKRILVEQHHVRDEIGILALSANAFMEATESALTEIKALASTDMLTQIPNRRRFMERLEEELNRMQRISTGRVRQIASVLMFDVDHFKQINDTYGHAAGDQVLRELGQAIKQGLRKSDIAGRIGGEEFAILLANTDWPQARLFAERIREQVAELSITYEARVIRVTISVGLSLMLQQQGSTDVALSQADEALYHAKRSGRNRVVVYAPLLERTDSDGVDDAEFNPEAEIDPAA